MSKKIIVFAVLIVSALSVMIISLLGTLPEAGNVITLERIAISDFDTEVVDANGHKRKVKYIENYVTEKTPYYEFTYVLTPERASVTLNALSSDERITAIIDPTNNKVRVSYDAPAVIAKVAVTITISDSDTQRSDAITLIFKSGGPIIIE